jgi:hypothetical protein
MKATYKEINKIERKNKDYIKLVPAIHYTEIEAASPRT